MFHTERASFEVSGLVAVGIRSSTLKRVRVLDLVASPTWIVSKETKRCWRM